jgi:uncharacterized protein YbjT (DUF2867 family)
VVISCAEDSVSLGHRGRRAFAAIGRVIHGAQLREAIRACAYRFFYRSVHSQETCAASEYVKAHVKFVASLWRAPVEATVVRTTGIFSALEDLLPMARCGVLPLVGNGAARTNPIDPQEVAESVAGCVASGPAGLPSGGPRVLSRREIPLARARALDRSGALLPRMPAPILRLAAKLLCPFHPRLVDLLEIFAAVGTIDCIAMVRGQRTLDGYLAARSC